MERTDAGDTPDRRWVRIGLVLCTLVVVVATALLMPAFGTDGVTGSPLERILPGESAGETAGDSQFGDTGGLGALNPGDSTGVGGDVGLDSETFATTDTAIHFTVESPTSSYWRTGAYDRYTGAGWERTGGTAPLDGPIELDGIDGESIEWEIQFQRSATAVPTAWRPRVVEGVDSPQLTDQGAVRTEQPIEAGDTVQGVSYSPQRDAGALRATGREYPDEISERYTQLPADTPQRIEDFTTDLTADDESPYEQAITIENWLERSKAYDLDVSVRSDTIADTFIFEMDAGYCEYFATAMVSMLRSQDIPARYVIGYSSGQPVGENTYELRAMNAHAWVEVYFEDFGWVRFDPTPAEPRLSTQQSALEEAGQEIDIDDLEPPERLNPGGDEPTDDGFQATLNRTALPGEPVEVTVTYDGFPIAFDTVYFNGEPVGRTDADGTVVGTVPDAPELRVTVAGNGTLQTDRRVGTPAENASVQDDERVTSPATFGASAGTTTGVGAASTTAGDVFAQDDDQRSDTHPIERNASLAVSGDFFPGESVTVTVTAGDYLLDDATVAVDGEPVGETDGNGQLEVDLPERTGNVTITAERGLVSGQRIVEVSELTLTVRNGLVPAMALGTVTVEARIGDEPAAGVPVEIDGTAVATTGTDGTATVRLPLAASATVGVTAAGQVEQVVLTGLLWRFGLAAVVAGLVAAFAAFSLLKRGYGPRKLGRLLWGLPGRALSGGRRALVAAVTDGDEYLARGAGRIRQSAATVGALVRGELSPGELKTATTASVSGLSGRLRRVLGRRRESADPAEGITVQEAWGEFVDQLSVGTVETRTPGELAVHAVEEDGLPAEPVFELRDAFREVEYGSRPPTDRLGRVQNALERIERDGEGDS